MKNLMQKIAAPLILATAGVIGCVTPAHPSFEISLEPIKPSQVTISEKSKGVDLKNGFFAESYSVFDDIHLITQVYLREVILKKTDKGYEGVKTNIYHTTPTEIYDGTFDLLCKDMDINEDKFLKKTETQSFLDMTYNAMRKVIWVEDDE